MEKEHKFFERYLNNDLDTLASELKDRYRKIQDSSILGVTPVSDEELFIDTGSVSTAKWRQYNVFQFHIPEIHKLFTSIRSMVIEACEYYEIDFDEQQFMVQGWFNVLNSDSGNLDWHHHSFVPAPNFHGYYSVNAEPSQTEYEVNGETVVVNNINNRAILSEAKHRHRVVPSEIKDRITVAYDIIPLKDVINNVNKKEYEQHWLPLA